jgi:hypothetical protein
MPVYSTVLTLTSGPMVLENILKPTKAVNLRNLKVGDKMIFSFDIRGHWGYSTRINCKNLQTGQDFTESVNMLTKYLKYNFEFKPFKN